MIFELAEDFRQAVEHMPRGHERRRMLELFDEAIRRDIHFIARHREDYPQALFQCLWNSCWWYDCPEAAKHYDPPEGGWSAEGPPWERPGPKLSKIVEVWRAARKLDEPGPAWVRSLRPPYVELGGHQLLVLTGHRQEVSSASFSGDGARVLTASSAQAKWPEADMSARLWDAATGRQVAAFHGHESGIHSAFLARTGHACSPTSAGSWGSTSRQTT